jgi:hypothetical protein
MYKLQIGKMQKNFSSLPVYALEMENAKDRENVFFKNYCWTHINMKQKCEPGQCHSINILH